MLSRRTQEHRAENALTAALARERAREGKLAAIVDLTTSNPTTAGLPYARGALQASLSRPGALVYEPAPLGLPIAREAAARAFASTSVDIDPSRVAVMASTSEAYGALLKVLCDVGDAVLVPAPSYPLLAWLARFEGVELIPYPLVYADRWHVDLDAVRARVTERTRAIFVVSPNNPTGSYLARGELEALAAIGLPIVSDEVFAPYPLVGREDQPLRDALAEHGLAASALDVRHAAPLVFSLSGLSKLAGLPQMKAAWIGVGGTDALARDALSRLELVCDVYLSVSAPTQHALGALLDASDGVTRAIRARTRKNLARLRAVMQAAPSCSVLHAEGGWYAMVRVPETRSDEAWALSLLEGERVYVHPGYFFDVARGAMLVVSLLCPEAALEEGARRIARHVEAHA